MVASPLRLLLVCALGAGCSIELTTTIHGSGTPRSELRRVADFDRVEVDGGLECVIAVGGATTLVTLQGDDNLLERVETEARAGVLRVSVPSGDRLEPRPRVELQVPRLRRLELAGSGSARVTGLAGERFTLALSGSGQVLAQGLVERLEVRREGSGEVDCSEVIALEANVRTQGSGYVYVDVRGRLDVDLSGSGHVVYRGSPIVSARTRGSGDVRRLSD